MKHPSALAEALGALKPEKPLTDGRLTLLPFTCRRPGRTRYVLLETAIRRGRLTVTEVSHEGSVPYLKAVNEGPWPVLIFDGEELVGAKQNRIVNSTILVGVGESVLPVSCVERGRWSHRSRAFASGRWTSHPSLRREKELQVRRSLAAESQAVVGPERSQAMRASLYQSDQGSVWERVAQHSRDLGVESGTEAMADAYCALGDDLDQVLLAFSRQESGAVPGEVPVEGMVGVAVFLAGSFLCLDTLWSARRFRELYPKLLRGYALEALRDPGVPGAGVADPEAEVLRSFAELVAADPRERAGVDLGTDLRVEAKTVVGAGLSVEGDLVQLSVFPR